MKKQIYKNFKCLNPWYFYFTDELDKKWVFVIHMFNCFLRLFGQGNCLNDITMDLTFSCLDMADF